MHLTTLQIVYLVLGPGMWLLIWVGVLLARSRMNRLLKPLKELPSHPPQVTIVVPAKDEAARIRECVESVLSQDYPNFTALFIDDRSDDDTGKILDQFAQASPGKMRVHHIPHGKLPDGWLGKCHALHVGTRDVTSPWLCFVDSDVTLQPGALSDVMKLALWREYDAISLLTRIDGRTFWEKLMIPLAAGTWTILFMASVTNNDNRKDSAVANGQFILVRRDAYEQVRGHEGVRAQITEDVELMRSLKQAGFTCRLMMGAHLAATRMHATLSELRHGWGRIYSGTARMNPGRMLIAMVWIVVCALSAYPMLPWSMMNGSRTWIALSAAHVVLMHSYLLHLYGLAKISRVYSLAFPVGAVVLLELLGHGVHRCFTKRVIWRGSTFVTR